MHAMSTATMPTGQRFSSARLRELIKGLQMSPEQMGKEITARTKVSVTGTAIRGWLLEKNYPTVRALHALADAFGVDIRSFFDVPPVANGVPSGPPTSATIRPPRREQRRRKQQA